MCGRIGVYKSWLSWKTLDKRALEYVARMNETDGVALRHYAETGSYPVSHPDLVSMPAFELIDNLVHRYANGLGLLAELRGGRGERYEELCSQSAAALKISFMISALKHERFPRRHKGRNLKKMSLKDSLLLALTLALGNEVEGKQIGRMMIEAYRRGYFFDKDQYPVFHFILRLFCDWSGEEPPEWEANPLQESIMNKLFLNWKEESCERLAPYVLAACDYHTHRCKPSGIKGFYEFCNGDWTRFPVELLMLYRLRYWIGLENPQVDHPIMVGAFTQMPEKIPLVPDALTSAVLAQMVKQGYNEKAIYASFCGRRVELMTLFSSSFMMLKKYAALTGKLR